MSKLKIAFIILFASVLAFGVTYVYCQVKVNETYSGLGFYAEEIEKPDDYWILTNPDKWTLEAIENPETTVFCYGSDVAKVTFWKQASQHGGSHNVEYQGKYYHITVGSWDAVPAEITDQPYYEKVITYSPAVFTTFGILGAVLSVVWFKRNH